VAVNRLLGRHQNAAILIVGSVQLVASLLLDAMFYSKLVSTLIAVLPSLQITFHCNISSAVESTCKALVGRLEWNGFVQ